MSDFRQALRDLELRVGTKEAREGAAALERELVSLQSWVKEGLAKDDEVVLRMVGLLERGLQLAVNLAVQANEKAARTTDRNLALEARLAAAKKETTAQKQLKAQLEASSDPASKYVLDLIQGKVIGG